MSYNSRIYKTAQDILQQRRDKTQAIFEERKREIYENIPEYSMLKNELIDLVGSNVKNVMDNKSVDKEALKENIEKNKAKTDKLLVENGYAIDYLDKQYVCKLCKDTGYVNEKRCLCFDKLLKDIALKEANLSYMLTEQNFDNFDLKMFSSKKDDAGISPKENMKNILKHIKIFMDNFENIDCKSLLFVGNTGVGKTFLSSCIARKMLDEGKGVLYQSAAKLTEILEEYKFNRENAIYDTKNIVKDIYDIDLLIIDDFGTEFKTSYTLTALYELINHRIINNKKMIISTNLTLTELRDVYSERLSSRFIGEFSILEFIGEDLRTKKILNK